MKKTKPAAVITAAVLGCSLLPQLAAQAETPSDNVLMMCDFEDGATLPVTSSGSSSYDFVPSPIGSAYEKIGVNWPVDACTPENVEAGLAGFSKIVEAGKDNNVLKLTGIAEEDSNTVTIYDGIIPEDFVIDFSMLKLESYVDFSINIEQGEKSWELMRNDATKVSVAGNSYSNDFYTYRWLPYSMIFEDVATDNAQLTMYAEGRLNYTVKSANPQDYSKAYVDIGNYLSGIDLSENVKVTLVQEGDSSVYFDNIRLYRYENEISNEAGNDFEADTVGMLPMQNGIRTGGYITRQWFYADAENTSVQQNYGLIAYETAVAEDPENSSNKVLKGVRGNGSNAWSYDSAVRFTVNKPKEKLEISFKALTNSIYNIAADIEDGIFRDIFAMSEESTSSESAARIFTIGGRASNSDQLISLGTTPGKNAASLGWELDKWNDVTLVYDVKENKTSFKINGNEFEVTAKNDVLKEKMASDEDAITVAFFRPCDVTNGYIMLDDISIRSDGGNAGQPEPEPTPGITATEPQPVVRTDAPDTTVGTFWNVTVSDLERDTFSGTFTNDDGEMKRTFDISNISGEGSAVFSVILLGITPEEGITAEFE